MVTRITELLGIKYPIFQGGMAWVADSSLAAAVSEAGGFGILGSATAPADTVRKMISEVRDRTDKPFGVNIMLMSPYAEEVSALCAEEHIAAVTTGAGIPAKYIPMWREAGVRVIPVVASVAMAKMMEKSGVDAVVAEGCESGGHIGSLTTMALLPQVVDAVSIPVIGAGGIGDGRGMAAALMLGAEGVQMGTRFLVAEECTAHDNYKDKVINAKDIDSVVTGTSTGHPVRVLRNKMSKEYLELEKTGISIDELEKMTAGSLRAAVVDGDVVHGSVMAGQIAGLVSKRQTCSEIIEEIMKETAETINSKRDYIC